MQVAVSQAAHRLAEGRDHAMNEGLLREFTGARFARNFVTGVGLTNLDDVLAVADEVGLDLDTIMHGVTAEDIKNR